MANQIIDKALAWLGDTFRGCDNTRKQILASSTTTYTPTRDGYLTVYATTDSGQTTPSFLRIRTTSDMSVVGFSVGGTTATLGVSASAPIKKGISYTIDAGRCTVSSIVFYY